MRRQHGGGADIRHIRHALLHFLTDRDHHRAGAARHRNIKGMRHQFGDALFIINLCDPFRDGAEHAAIINFLEGFAVCLLHRDLADQQYQRR